MGGLGLAVPFLAVALSPVLGEDVTCGNEDISKEVTIKLGYSFLFATQKGIDYDGRTKCKVIYKRDDACPSIRFSCDCQGGDKLMVTSDRVKKGFCQSHDSDITTSGPEMKVVFMANKKKYGHGTNCTVECSAEPKPRQDPIQDLGYPNCGAGWYDVQGQGVANDYCRWVGNGGCRNNRGRTGNEASFWSCALAGDTNPYSPRGMYEQPIKPRQGPIEEPGYDECGAGWYDVQGQGIANDYCRWVGDGGCRNSQGNNASYWSCALAGDTNQLSPRGAYEQVIKPRQNPSDRGYSCCGAGWYDVQGQGVANDYCRWVGNGGCRNKWNKEGDQASWWSCALAGETNQYSPRGAYNQTVKPRQTPSDTGYTPCNEGWFDVQCQGVANDYCRWVGNGGCRNKWNKQGDQASWWSCALAGSTNQYSGRGVYEEIIKPRQNPIRDLGYSNCGAGWYDVQGQGVANDYCRWVGNGGCRNKWNKQGDQASWWSCALAGSTDQYSGRGVYRQVVKPRQDPIQDRGYGNCAAGWYDVQGQGVANDYCRWVGNGGCRNQWGRTGNQASWWSCALAGTTTVYSSRGAYNEP